ncbi:hypothetical protein PsorP6_000024 [Peronosclerospora sorghi]|uniref:Uncharacterized protein n=1 Tax=Peronosclerospora sorghi TaxID=230839 RepID=A0ACC0WSB4_9STRA|nr:hypothetical protein PsorP6_000024 [Peronosclerospora sorghi]
MSSSLCAKPVLCGRIPGPEPVNLLSDVFASERFLPVDCIVGVDLLQEVLVHDPPVKPVFFQILIQAVAIPR